MKRRTVFSLILLTAVLIITPSAAVNASSDVSNGGGTNYSSAAPNIYGEGASVYSSHKNNGSKIALTFDDGPHPKYTPQILEILSKYKIPATFFVIGKNAEKYPGLIKREIKEGHEVGNHTENHVFLQKASESQISTEILDAENTLYEIADYRPKLVRPPGGLYNKSVCRVANQMDYSVILWTVDTKDWAHTPANKISEQVLSDVNSGDIILMHDFIGGKSSPTPEALETIIPKLLRDGYSFVTVSELISSK